jgi:RNA polymerase sigma-70 factor (ECF subfamily)
VRQTQHNERRIVDDDGVAFHLADQQAFLAAVIRSVVPQADAAADVLQRVNLAIWRKREDFRSGTSFRNWALAVVRYELLAYRRTLARSREVMLSPEAEEMLVSQASGISTNDMEDPQQALRKCLELLRPEQMELLKARYERSETIEDFANRLGRSVGGMRVTLHRLRKSLKKCIEQRLGREASAID